MNLHPASQCRLPDPVRARLDDLLGQRVTDHPGLRRAHSDHSTWITPQPPDLVAFPESTAEVQQIVRICADARAPVIPYGAGTSLEGQVNAPRGGVSVDFSRMNRVLSVEPEDLSCTVEAGVTRLQLNAHLRDSGLFFPIDPGADATIGGMAATRASGTTAVRYGTMREQVLRLTAVMSDGTVISTGSRARKSSAGYDLTHLLVGSAGTLGLITEVTLRLHGRPEAVAGAVVAFPEVADACAAAALAIRCGLPMARLELLDATQIAMCNRHSGLSLAVLPTLFVEIHGSEGLLHETLDSFAAIAEECRCTSIDMAATPEARARLWKARHEVSSACRAWRPGATFVGTDVCVPISRLADFVAATRADLDARGLTGSILGHVGDGNFHVALLVDMGDQQEVRTGKDFVQRLARRAIAMDGTCSGEHGIGQGKMTLLAEEAPTALPAMRAIKRALDPLNILNPGKTFEMDEAR